ncbi:MAG: hypothetical protein Q9217_006060 [Psora testacea]
MEETLEEDIKLQRASADLIAQIDHSLPLLLRKTVSRKKGRLEHGRVRCLVRDSRTNEITKLVSGISGQLVVHSLSPLFLDQLDQFQELPQLLDRHLSGFVQCLSSAFLEYLDHHENQYDRLLKEASPTDIIPLPRAICKVLYVLCKVRGQKVIAQLLNNEAKYLEPMLRAFQNWSKCKNTSSEMRIHLRGRMTWEERYIMLLWLSHLVLIPFDLTTVASCEAEHGFSSPLRALNLPLGTPKIGQRLLGLALQYIVSPSKESDSAKILLVRLTLRTDMLTLGLHQPLVLWALDMLEYGNIKRVVSTYQPIGALSFLSGFVKSADNAVMRQMLEPIWESIQHMLEEKSLHLEKMLSSAVVRKLIIKLHRLLGVTAHRLHRGATYEKPRQILEDALCYLLEALDDNETSVRFAASKALSVVALQCGEESTSDIIDRLKENLETNLCWTEVTGEMQMADARNQLNTEEGWPDYTYANAMEWHGCILTLAHLLFRHAIPTLDLEKVIFYLCLALNFDQRSALGASIGTNIRDAACFGFWALSRNYATCEMVASSSHVAGDTSVSLLQHIANKLIEAACLDLSGNIRRGTSAALQELVGRHPDTIASGIVLVQCVDYHAVASRHGAMMLVGIQAADKEAIYEHVLFRGLLGWRGIQSPDASTRRLSAETIGRLLSRSCFLRPMEAIKILKDRLGRTRLSDIEQRHGLILALSHIFESLHAMQHGTDEGPTREWSCLSTDPSVMRTSASEQEGDEMHDLGLILDFHSGSAAEQEDLSAAERSQYTHEARSRLIWNLASAACCRYRWHKYRVPISTFDPLMAARGNVQLSLIRQEDLVVKFSPHAMVGFMVFTPANERRQLLESMITTVRCRDPRYQGLHKVGAISAVGLATIAFQDPATDGTISSDVDAIIQCLLEQTHAGNDIEVRCAALQSFAQGPISLCKVIPEEVVSALQVCLDDYTNDHRGDVGSLVRTAAIDTAGLALRKRLVPKVARAHIVARICALAAEKLDKVRYHAATCLQTSWNFLDLYDCEQVTAMDAHETMTVAHFSKILALRTDRPSSLTILRGFVSTAGDGSASAMQSSRTALVAYTEQMPLTGLSFFCSNLAEIIRTDRDRRVSIWAMEVVAFLFEAQIIRRLLRGDVSWRNLFSTINHAHFKSTDIRRLEAAIAVYSGLASIDIVKVDVLKKLCDMLRNPIAKIRNNAADALFSTLQDEEMLVVNWSCSPRELKYEREKILAKIETLARSDLQIDRC